MKLLKKASLGLAALAVVLTITLFALHGNAEAAQPAADTTTAAASETTEETATAETADTTTGDKALAAAIAIGLAAGCGAVGMGLAIGKSAEGISRQPEAGGQIRTALMLGLVFIETAIIYALIVAILIVFVM